MSPLREVAVTSLSIRFILPGVVGTWCRRCEVRNYEFKDGFVWRVSHSFPVALLKIRGVKDILSMAPSTQWPCGIPSIEVYCVWSKTPSAEFQQGFLESFLQYLLGPVGRASSNVC